MIEKVKILLIDDEKDLCRVTKLNLERGGRYQVTMAHSGREGLAKAAQGVFDLIITDYNMPGLDGGKVLLTLKARQPAIPVVLFSVYHDDPVTVTPAMARAADGLVSKPIDHEQLCNTIERALARCAPALRDKERADE